MKILALEFSTEMRSVSVGWKSPARSEDTTRVLKQNVFIAASDSRNVGGLTLVDQVLTEAKLGREEIGCIAVGLGPGSYTGIRSAISLAQGWQLALGVRLLGVSSMDCLIARAHADGVRGKVNFIIDAQRGEFYLATCTLGDSHPEPGERLRLATLAEIQAPERAGELIAGPEVTRWFPAARQITPDAAMLVSLANGRDDFVAGEELQPVYLRESQFVKAPPPRLIP